MAQNTSDLIKLTNVNNVNNESIRNREHINRNIDGRTQVLQFQHVYACTCAASLLSTKARTSCELIFRTSLRFHMQRFTTKLFPELRTDSCNVKPMYTYIKCTQMSIYFSLDTHLLSDKMADPTLEVTSYIIKNPNPTTLIFTYGLLMST